MRLSARLIVLILCSILVQGGQAIDIGFSASNGGKSVSMWNTYIVDDSVSVSERDSVNPNDLEMTGSRVVSGSGDANIHQELAGSGGGADWTADHTVSIENAASLQDLSSTSLKPVSCEVSRSTNVWNCDIAENELYGHQGGDHAVTSSYVSGGDLSCIQNLLVGHSVEVSQIVSMNAYTGSKVGEVYGEAWDVDGNYAWIYAGMANGVLETNMNVKAATGNTATATQSTEIGAEIGATGSNARDADRNYAGTYARMENGVLETNMNAKANTGNSATATQSTEIEAKRGDTSSRAQDADGNYAGTSAEMENGVLETNVNAKANTGNSATATQSTEIEAEYGATCSRAQDADRNYANTYADIMGSGTLTTMQNARVGNGVVEAAQYSKIQGHLANSFCEAGDIDGYEVYVDNWVEGNSYLEFTGEAVANSNQFRASQTSHAEGLDIWPWASAESPTKDTGTIGEYVHYNGNRDVESVAWANSNDVFADIQVV